MKNFFVAMIFCFVSLTAFSQIDIVTADETQQVYDSICIKPDNILLLKGQELLIIPLNNDANQYSCFYDHFPTLNDLNLIYEDPSKNNYMNSVKLSGKKVIVKDVINDKSKDFNLGPRYLKLFDPISKDDYFFDTQDPSEAGYILATTPSWCFVPTGAITKISRMLTKSHFIFRKTISLKDFYTKSVFTINPGDSIYFEKLVIVKNAGSSSQNFGDFSSVYKTQAGNSFLIPLGNVSDTFCSGSYDPIFEKAIIDASEKELNHLSADDWNNVVSLKVEKGMSFNAVVLVKGKPTNSDSWTENGKTVFTYEFGYDSLQYYFNSQFKLEKIQ